jgi:hypothetical protein
MAPVDVGRVTGQVALEQSESRDFRALMYERTGRTVLN